MLKGFVIDVSSMSLVTYEPPCITHQTTKQKDSDARKNTQIRRDEAFLVIRWLSQAQPGFFILLLRDSSCSRGCNETQRSRWTSNETVTIV